MTKHAITVRRRHLIGAGDGRDPVDELLRWRTSIAWSDPTHFAGTALAEDWQLLEMQRIVEAIEEVHQHPSLPVEARRVMELRYWKCEPVNVIGEGLSMSRETVYRWRKAVLATVATRLGWL